MWGSLEDLHGAGINIRKILTGALVGLTGVNTFLGLGLIEDIDMQRRNMRLYTPVEWQRVNEVYISELYLDKNGHEIGAIYPWGE
jgi:polynucleotide 5'-kinase involved in rRNA processing